MTSAEHADLGGHGPDAAVTRGPGGAQAATRPSVVTLGDVACLDRGVVGGKAASLAQAAAADLNVLPGVVLTTWFCAAVDGGAAVTGHPAVREAYDRAGGDEHRLVARSSSVVEDMSVSSMAGRFESVVGIDGLDAFVAAVQTVLDSRRAAGAAGRPIAVLVQPLLEPALGGIMFGVDPVTGRSDRRVVSAVRGGPDPLVSGQVDGSRDVLDASGTVVEHAAGDGPTLDRADLRRLAGLSATVGQVFGGPQDIEWAIDRDGTLWLLQSRPVTTPIAGVPRGPVYGPGPVAETFPEPLTELEQDLWVVPLREAVIESVLLARAAPAREVEASDVVVAVGGHVAIDLHLAGEVPLRHGVTRTVNPLLSLRRIRGAWRVGRLRAALPGLAEQLLDRVDHDLEAVPALPQLTSRQLLALLHRSRTILRALHAHEILMGMLTDTGSNRMTGASVALRVLAEAREDGLSDDEILGRSPIVLALAPPRVAPRPVLPESVSALNLGPGEDGGSDDGVLREALRLRVRWIQELSGRVAWALGARLEATGGLPEPELIRHMSLDQIEAVATKRAMVVPALLAAHEHEFGPPLPARFQISNLGVPIRVLGGRETGGGTGAGGGVAEGPVTYDISDPPAGAVLVTATLTPGLAPLLPRLHGIVAETGSVLSHLAILARESGVATVVGYSGATADLPEGVTVLVDGETGHVTVEDVTATHEETTP